jgi:hypothetical protein
MHVALGRIRGLDLRRQRVDDPEPLFVRHRVPELL